MLHILWSNDYFLMNNDNFFTFNVKIVHTIFKHTVVSPMNEVLVCKISELQNI